MLWFVVLFIIRLGYLLFVGSLEKKESLDVFSLGCLAWEEGNNGHAEGHF